MLFPSIKTVALIPVLMLTAVCGAIGRADEFPGLGVGWMWQNELAFQNQFYNWAAQGAWEVARNTPDNQPLPFNAMTISNSITEGSHAFEGYIHHSQDLSNRQLRAVEDFSNTAIRGYAPYYDSSGYQPPVMLPWGPSAYTPMYEGFSPEQNVFVPNAFDFWQQGTYTPMYP